MITGISGRSELAAEEGVGRLGVARLEPAGPIVAGTIGSWTLTLVVGSYGIDEGGTIKIARRLANDWEPPQFDRPNESGFCTLWTDGEAILQPHYERKGHIRPWLKCIVIDVVDGALRPGDTVRLVLGDQSQGSPGLRAQTFVESAHEIRVLVDPTNASLVRALPGSPVTAIVPSRAVNIVAVAPSVADLHTPIKIRFRGEDRWGNPAPVMNSAKIVWIGSGAVYCDPEGFATAATSCVGRFRVTCGSFEQLTNPVRFIGEPAQYLPFWGDLHAQTGGTVGTGTEDEYFRFGRDQAFLDFIGHQGNDFQISSEDWVRLNASMAGFHKDHEYVVIPGYEWSANTPAGGDRNVFFREENPPIFRSSHWQVPHEVEDAGSPAHPADELFKRIKEHGNAFTCAHVGGRYADITRYFDQDVCPLVEVISCWGVFEWILKDALDRDFVVGVMANSDGHKGRPGAEGPGAGEFGIGGGLTCVLAPELTRNAVFDALMNRRCYGTTGPRIHIEFDVAGHPMGWKGPVPSPSILTAQVFGVSSLERLELFRGTECIETVWHPAFAKLRNSRRIRVLWKGARHRGRGRRITWSGRLSITGAKIQSAKTIAFDSPSDGIVDQAEQSIDFRSHTTGDADALEIVLDRPDFDTITLDTPQGTWMVEGENPALSTPNGLVFDLGTLEKTVRFQRYPDPASLDYLPLMLKAPVAPLPKRPHTAYYIKAIQTDGHMAWTSPVYLESSEAAYSEI